MSPAALSLLSLALAANVVLGQVTGTYPATPLASKHFSYPSGIVSFIPWRYKSLHLSVYLQPYKVDTDQGLVRGTQVGYNICNSTTENQSSLCQTSIFNALDGMWPFFLPPTLPS